MARVLLSAQQPSRAGVVPNFTAANASGGNNFANDGRTFIEVKNASASPINVTLNIPMTVDGNTVTAPVVVIPATTGDKIIGPFPPAIFNQADGTVNIDFSATTSVTVGVFQLP